MFRKSLLAFALVASLSLAAAQVLVPTTQDGSADAFNQGTSEASVTQSVSLLLPQVTALHLDVTDLVFDLTGDLSQLGNDIVCVYGSEDTDVSAGVPAFPNAVRPLGTSYSTAMWPNIEILGTTGSVTRYAPYKTDKDGDLVEGSKDYFVCYRSFIIQKFSNGTDWDISVERAVTDGTDINHLYIQDNLCSAINTFTPMVELNEGDTFSMLPDSLTTGPTGESVKQNHELCGYKSWLDDLVVIAVKVNADHAGTNTATLTYTLQTTAWKNF